MREKRLTLNRFVEISATAPAKIFGLYPEKGTVAIGSDAEVIVLDLRRLSFMDSTGLHVLVKGQQRAHEASRRLVLTKGSEQVQRLLDLTHVAELMSFVDSPADALEADRAPDSP